MNEIGFYRLTEVLKIIPVCRSKWFYGIKKGLYPQPIKHGKSSFWPKSDIHNLVRQIKKDGEKNELMEEEKEE